MSDAKHKRIAIIPIIPKDVRRIVPHVHSDGLTLIVTTDEGDAAIGWSSAAEALKDAARIIEAVAQHTTTK